jgi:hypothetical protein
MPIDQRSVDAVTAAWGAPALHAAANRIAPGQGQWKYHDTGNPTADGTGDRTVYDGKNRQTAFCVFPGWELDTVLRIAGKYGSQSCEGRIARRRESAAWMGAGLALATTAADAGARRACGGLRCGAKRWL